MDFIRPRGFGPTAKVPVKPSSFQISFWLFSIKVLSSAREGESNSVFVSRLNTATSATKGTGNGSLAFLQNAWTSYMIETASTVPQLGFFHPAHFACVKTMKGWRIHHKIQRCFHLNDSFARSYPQGDIQEVFNSKSKMSLIDSDSAFCLRIFG